MSFRIDLRIVALAFVVGVVVHALHGNLWFYSSTILGWVLMRASLTRHHCVSLERPGVGEIHMHSWPWWAKEKPRRIEAWYFPEGQRRALFVAPCRIAELINADTLIEAMAIMRREHDHD